MRAVLQVAALVAVVGAFALLSGCGGANQPVDGAAASGGSGRDVYVQVCAVCHGPKGEGGAGLALAGGATASHYPNSADEEAVVRNGIRLMPSFRDTLTPDQIRAVVAYTRGL